MKKKNKIYKSLKEYFEKRSYIIILLIGVALIFYTPILIGVLFKSIQNNLYFLDINWKALLTYLKAYGMLILILYILTKWCRVVNKKKRKWIYKAINHLNGYVWLSLFLILFLSSFGFGILNTIYSPSLPTEFSSIDISRPGLNESVKSLSPIKCDNDHHEFIVGDHMDCEFRIEHYENPPLVFEYLDIYYEGTEEDKNPERFYVGYNNVNLFSIPINEEGINKYRLSFKFINSEKTLRSEYLRMISFDAISYKDYKDDKSRLFTLLFTIITIASFSVVAFVRNLKHIMEPKDKK